MDKVSVRSLIAELFYGLHHIIKHGQSKEIWCKGGRGSTKSSFISIQILLGLMADSEANAIVSRRYDNELRDSVFGQMKWAAWKLGVDHLWKFMISPMQAIYQPTGQKVLFKGADNPLKLKSVNLGRGYVKYAWFEEVDQYGGFFEIRNILQSVFRGTDANRTAFFSYNPPKSSRSWVNQEVTIPKPGRHVHHSDYRSVPVEWLGERFIADAEHLKSVNESAYRHEYLGEEIGTGLEVFNNVNIRLITQDERLQFDNILQGLDFGYAVDPLCFLRMHLDTKRRRLFIFEEVSGIGISNRQLAERLTDDQKRTLTTADSAEPKSIDELRHDYSLRIKGAKKGKGSIEAGVKWLADLESITIDPVTCPLAAREFVNYALNTDRSGEVISKYPDKDNHAIDTARYAVEDHIVSKKANISTDNTARFGL
jgi:phage terminase large subunit